MRNTCEYAELCVFVTNNLEPHEIGACVLVRPLAGQIEYLARDKTIKGDLPISNCKSYLSQHRTIIGNCPNLEIDRLLKMFKNIITLCEQF